jgi:small subunit ribosomal protein S7
MYNSKLVTKLINNVMEDGKKGVAQKIVYDAFETVAQKTGKDALEAFTEALENIMPVLEVKARRVGGSTYQVPMEVRPERRQTLGLRWLIGFSRKRSERTMALDSQVKLRMHSQTPAQLSRKKKKHTEWQSQQSFCSLQI